ncbi:MAG: hypothetical protein K9N49_07695 [Candidatus Marinimicrobia bacterium]|nr:hypothetical protein [Candidatus Neomarinimicrobiota bacterium]
MKYRFIKRVVLLNMLAFTAMTQTGASDSGAPPRPSHPPPIIVGDMFQFVEGAWAEYDILDKIQDRTLILRMSILGQEQVRRSLFSRRRAYRWLEFDVQMPDEPRVVVKYLARETAQGPGEPHEMILQIEEYENPIRLGRRWLQGNEEEEFVDSDYVWIRQQAGEERITHGGRTFSAWRVQSQAEDGITVEAIVSDELPPFGLYFAETPEQRMTLRDWGTEARSAITGEPLGLARWIFRQVQAGMREE